MSARLKLTLSYAGIVVVSGLLLLAAVALYLLRYVPDVQIPVLTDLRVPNRSDLIRAFVPVAATVMVVLLALGLGGDGCSPDGCWRRSSASATRLGSRRRDRCRTG
nr:hypothetical protein [Microbacterium sp. Se5.02b]